MSGRDAAAYPHHLEFVVLHPDTPLPNEDEVDTFFCPGFWRAPDFKSWKSNYYFDFPSPGDWNELDLQKLDAAHATVAIVRLGRVRAGDAATDFPLFADEPVAPHLERLQAGVYPPLPGLEIHGWALSRLGLWAIDAVDVHDFLTTVERFLLRMHGVVVDPALLTAAQFHRRYLHEPGGFLPGKY